MTGQRRVVGGSTNAEFDNHWRFRKVPSQFGKGKRLNSFIGKSLVLSVIRVSR